MHVAFDSLPESSRLWIYQSDRLMSSDQKELVNALLTDYCAQWAAHGQPLKASFQIYHDLFIVLSVDESQHSASGCSIDDSVRAIKHIQDKTGLNFFNRQLVAFLIDGRIQLVDLAALKENFASGTLDAGMLTFNNVIDYKHKLSEEWLVPAGKTWLKRYITAEILKS